MRAETIHLTEQYDFLRSGDADPTLVGYIQNPARAGRIRPAVIVVPGGGYTHHGMMEGDPIAVEFLREGYQAFILYYSVTPHAYPQQTLELAAAVDYVSRHADEYGLDPEKIVLIGFSAGGHLAATYTAFAARPEIASLVSLHPIAAMILGYPLLYALNTSTHDAIVRFSGKVMLSEEEIKHFSPPYHITSTTPPTFLWHTAEDGAVPIAGTFRYAEALCSRGIPTEVHTYPKGGHALVTGRWPATAEPESEAARAASSWVPLAMRWLDLLFHL